MDAMTYNRMFTLHGVIMVWLFMIPSIPTVFGNFVLPIMIGAKDVAFPRLNLASFYIYVLGAALTVGGMLAGGTDTGWTFYAPYSDSTPTAVVPVVIGIFILGISTILTGINFIVTTHTMRAQGMTLDAACRSSSGRSTATSIIRCSRRRCSACRCCSSALDHGLQLGHLRSGASAATRCSSSTCSGSTRTPPSTS